LLVGVVALSAGLPLAAYAGGVFHSLELTSVDTRFSVRGSSGQPKDLAVVAIDSKTFSDFNDYRATHPGFDSAWPFPRCDVARVLDRIAADRPKVIAVDLQFTEPTTASCDDALITAVSRDRPVILGASETDAHGRTNVFGGLPLAQLGAAAGSTNVIPDYGGVIRRIPYSVDRLTTFAVAAAAFARGKQVPAPRAGLRWIDFAGGPGTMKTYSFSDVFFGKVPAGAFDGKAVVVGPTASTFQDVHATSVSGDPSAPMAGPEIQANAIETALRGFPLRTTPAWLNVLLVVLLAALPAVAILWLRPLLVLPLALGVGLVFVGAAQLAFDHGSIVLLVYPLAALALSTFGSMIVCYETAAGDPPPGGSISSV
jgi:CHASE2 domain-containing sensor protein